MPTRVRRCPAPVHRSRRASARALALLVAWTLGGCATNEATTPDQRERQYAAIERYDRCLDRRLARVADAAALGARRTTDCEGHRRDVLKTYPVHMEERVARMLDERAARRSGASPAGSTDATSRPIIQRMMELLTGD